MQTIFREEIIKLEQLSKWQCFVFSSHSIEKSGFFVILTKLRIYIHVSMEKHI